MISHDSDEKILILDGGLSNEIESLGGNLDSTLWTSQLLIDNPDIIRNAHLNYYKHGADVVITSSYQTSYDGFRKKGLNDDKTTEILQLSVKLACEARTLYQNKVSNKKLLVAASIGPYGASLADGSEYNGNYKKSITELKDWHRKRFNVLSKCDDVDFLICETIPCIDEIKALLELLKENNNNLKCAFSISCKDKNCLNSGEKIEEFNELFQKYEQKHKILAVGINCTAPEYCESLLLKLNPPRNIKKLVYPNSGEKWDANAKIWYHEDSDITKKSFTIDTNEQFCQYAKKWYRAGARIIGGCCRTTPKTIKMLHHSFSLK